MCSCLYLLIHFHCICHSLVLYTYHLLSVLAPSRDICCLIFTALATRMFFRVSSLHLPFIICTVTVARYLCDLYSSYWPLECTFVYLAHTYHILCVLIQSRNICWLTFTVLATRMFFCLSSSHLQFSICTNIVVRYQLTLFIVSATGLFFPLSSSHLLTTYYLNWHSPAIFVNSHSPYWSFACFKFI